MFRSLDGGRSWVEINSGFPKVGIPKRYPPVTSISVAPSDSNTVYFATYLGSAATSYRSTDGGANWEEASGTKNFFGVRQVENAISLAVDPADSTCLCRDS